MALSIVARNNNARNQTAYDIKARAFMMQVHRLALREGSARINEFRRENAPHRHDVGIITEPHPLRFNCIRRQADAVVASYAASHGTSTWEVPYDEFKRYIDASIAALIPPPSTHGGDLMTNLRAKRGQSMTKIVEVKLLDWGEAGGGYAATGCAAFYSVQPIRGEDGFAVSVHRVNNLIVATYLREKPDAMEWCQKFEEQAVRASIVVSNGGLDAHILRDAVLKWQTARAAVRAQGTRPSNESMKAMLDASKYLNNLNV